MIELRLLEQFDQQVAQREPIKLLVAYVLKERVDDPDHPWNWCDVCQLEVPVLRQHGRPVRCEGCNRVFVVSHAAEVENAKLRASPWFDGMIHDITSACWSDFSLELAPRQPALVPGSLAFAIEPYELPRQQLKIGERKLTRAERRKQARSVSGRGRRFARTYGRGRERHVPLTEDVYGEPRTYIPEAIRIPTTQTMFRRGPRGLPNMRDVYMDHVAYRCYEFGYSANMCVKVCCGAKMVVRAMLYAATNPFKHEGVRRKLDELMRPMVNHFAARLHELDMACWRRSKHDMVQHIDRSKLL